MIPVKEQPEPKDFGAKIRSKGLAHLESEDIVLDKPLPPKADIQPYWRACLTELHQAYDGFCAYLGVYFERGMGGARCMLIGAKNI